MTPRRAVPSTVPGVKPQLRANPFARFDRATSAWLAERNREQQRRRQVAQPPALDPTGVVAPPQ